MIDTSAMEHRYRLLYAQRNYYAHAGRQAAALGDFHHMLLMVHLWQEVRADVIELDRTLRELRGE